MEAGRWGIGADNVLRGPGGLLVDLNRCPDSWSDTAGIDDESIQLAQTSPLSGGIVDSAYSPGVEAYVQVVNEAGGIGGRQIELAVWHDPADPDIRPLMADVAGFDPDVYIQMTAGNPCLVALEGAQDHGLVDRIDRADRIFITASFCTQPSAYLIPAGDAGTGAMAVGRSTAFSTTRPQFDDGAVASWVRAELAAQNRDADRSLTWTGFVDVGWPLVEALRIADALPGGLSRSNLLLAMHSLDLDHPGLPPGVAYRTQGIVDRHLIEGGPMMEYDAEAHEWSTQVIVDVDGSTPTCAWEWRPVDSVYGQCVPDR